MIRNGSKNVFALVTCNVFVCCRASWVVFYECVCARSWLCLRLCSIFVAVVSSVFIWFFVYFMNMCFRYRILSCSSILCCKNRHVGADKIANGTEIQSLVCCFYSALQNYLDRIAVVVACVVALSTLFICAHHSRVLQNVYCNFG